MFPGIYDAFQIRSGLFSFLNVSIKAEWHKNCVGE